MRCVQHKPKSAEALQLCGLEATSIDWLGPYIMHTLQLTQLGGNGGIEFRESDMNLYIAVWGSCRTTPLCALISAYFMTRHVLQCDGDPPLSTRLRVFCVHLHLLGTLSANLNLTRLGSNASGHLVVVYIDACLLVPSALSFEWKIQKLHAEENTKAKKAAKEAADAAARQPVDLASSQPTGATAGDDTSAGGVTGNGAAGAAADGVRSPDAKRVKLEGGAGGAPQQGQAAQQRPLSGARAALPASLSGPFGQFTAAPALQARKSAGAAHASAGVGRPP